MHTSQKVYCELFETGIDFFNLRFVEIFERFAVRLSFRPDPYDIINHGLPCIKNLMCQPRLCLCLLVKCK